MQNGMSQFTLPEFDVQKTTPVIHLLSFDNIN